MSSVSQQSTCSINELLTAITHPMNGTPDSKLMYASEREENFRWIAKLVASSSRHVLTEGDLASSQIEFELEELGQYAEIASNNTVPIPFILKHIDQLVQPRFPLDGYTALKGSILVSEFFGRLAELHAYAAYRPSKSQLIVAISGTTGPVQAIQDLRFLFTPHPSGRGRVHTGFWSLYEGMRDLLYAAISKGLEEYPTTEELVLTGHSMGGAISYLLALDIISGKLSIPKSCRVKVVTYGSPRAGDENLVNYWKECVKAFHSCKELCVKGYNDGVHALPPPFLGYRHFSQECLYLKHGRLFHIPPSESEHSLFKVPKSTTPPLHPKGGHNYYNSHDMEKVLRRLKQVDVHRVDWAEAYLALEDASH